MTAGYLYPVRNSFAHFVVASIEGELKFFPSEEPEARFSKCVSSGIGWKVLACSGLCWTCSRHFGPGTD